MQRLFKAFLLATILTTAAVTAAADKVDEETQPSSEVVIVQRPEEHSIVPTTTNIEETLYDDIDTGYRRLEGMTDREFVNSLPYSLHISGPALLAYELVAADIGWDEQRIADWRRFMNAIIRKESGYCPNPLGGAQWRYHGRGCVLLKQGSRSDAGFGQMTKQYFYAEGMPLCEDHGLCSAEQIISEPYLSMAALLWTVEESGSKPWCYTKAQINHFNFGCAFAPDNPNYGKYGPEIEPMDGA